MSEPGADRLHGPFSRVVHVARTASTNADLAAALRLPDAADRWPHLSVLVADHQTEGRGRGGRVWETPSGSSLTASVVVRPAVPVERWSWIGLLTGAAAARALQAVTGLPTALKWPNDVLLLGAGARDEPGWGKDRKVAGVLVEAVPGEGVPAAVAGLGVNLHQARSEVPVPWATSLAEAGVPEAARDAVAILDAVGVELARLLGDWAEAGGDAEAAGVRAVVADACVTLGRHVRVALPGGREVSGRAVGLGPDGSLLLEGGDGGRVRVMAGDVDHLRIRTG